MRLFLLPISTRRSLLYCEPLSRGAPQARQSWSEWGISKANGTWAAWEKDTDSILAWKKRATTWGNMMFRRIPFEEWSLKSIPPLKRKDVSAGPKRVEVHFPSLYQGLCKDSVDRTLKNIATERQGLHKGRMWGSAFAMPFMAPFALVPV